MVTKLQPPAIAINNTLGQLNAPICHMQPLIGTRVTRLRRFSSGNFQAVHSVTSEAAAPAAGRSRSSRAHATRASGGYNVNVGTVSKSNGSVMSLLLCGSRSEATYDKYGALNGPKVPLIAIGGDWNFVTMFTDSKASNQSQIF